MKAVKLNTIEAQTRQMKKNILIFFLPLLTLALLGTGCEKGKSAPKEKIPVEKSQPEAKTPPIATLTAPEEAEIVESEETSTVTEDIPATDNQQYEGSATLKRYSDDSP